MRIQRLLRCEESKIEFHDDVLIPKYALLANVHQYYSRRALAVFQYFPQPQSRNSSRSESQSHEKFPISKVRKKGLTQRRKVPRRWRGQDRLIMSSFLCAFVFF